MVSIKNVTKNNGTISYKRVREVEDTINTSEESLIKRKKELQDELDEINAVLEQLNQ